MLLKVYRHRRAESDKNYWWPRTSAFIPPFCRALFLRDIAAKAV